MSVEDTQSDCGDCGTRLNVVGTASCVRVCVCVCVHVFLWSYSSSRITTYNDTGRSYNCPSLELDRYIFKCGKRP